MMFKINRKPTTVGDMLTHEFLEPFNLSQPGSKGQELARQSRPPTKVKPSPPWRYSWEGGLPREISLRGQTRMALT